MIRILAERGRGRPGHVVALDMVDCFPAHESLPRDLLSCSSSVRGSLVGLRGRSLVSWPIAPASGSLRLGNPAGQSSVCDH